MVAKEGLFQKLRLLVTAFGFGVLLMGTVALWDTILPTYRVLFLVVLAFSFYYCLLFAATPTSHSEHTHNEQHDTDTHTDEVIRKSEDKS
jgi:hypothetical protein